MIPLPNFIGTELQTVGDAAKRQALEETQAHDGGVWLGKFFKGLFGKKDDGTP